MADRLTIDTRHRFPSGVEIRAALDRSIEAGAILVLFGPSGAGKTTILRAIAGLDRPSEGTIAFGGETWVDVRSNRFLPPQARRVGFIPQDAALFPHLTVRANIEYGLRDMAADPRRVRSDGLMQALGLDDLAARSASALSGGQAQRVALARALAPAPKLLLLDEPFGALDASSRRQLRRDVRALVGSSGTRAILVTHDRLEAMAMGDELAVVADGRIRQAGPVADVFARPADPAVARAIGVDTVLPAVVVRREERGVGATNALSLVELEIGAARLLAVADTKPAPGDHVFACIRAEDVIIARRESSSGSARNHLAGTVSAIEPEGPIDRVTIDCGFQLVALITRQSRDELALAPGSAVAAAIKATAIHVVAKA